MPILHLELLIATRGAVALYCSPHNMHVHSVASQVLAALWFQADEGSCHSVQCNTDDACYAALQVAHRYKAAVLTIAGRWRNLHTAAAFGAWRSFVAQHKQHRSAAAAVAARWQNLHLATAFGCWRQCVAEAAERAAAADRLLARLAAATLAAAFFEWHQVAARKAHLRKQGVVVAGRQQRLYLELAYGGWKEAVQWTASKRAADAHWRQVVLRSVLVLWYRHTQQQAGYQKVSRALERQPLLL